MRTRPTPPPDAFHAARLARYADVSTALALLDDLALGRLVEAAPVLGAGIGGAAVRMTVEGTPVFAKRVRLTDVERLPRNLRSTADPFALPTFHQYGVGSAGSGVWRELAAHVMTTNWVLAGACGSFPLLYHWRVLDGAPPAPPLFTDPAELDRLVAFWNGSPAVRGRLEALAGASASVVLFCEYVPWNLHEWLTDRVAAGPAAAAAACAFVERELPAAVAFLNTAGLLHLDPHFRNVLTDGERVYVADFGLATSPRFDLSAAERRFVERHATHDGCYVLTELVNWLVAAVLGVTDRAARVALIRRFADGAEPAGVPAWAAAVLRRHAGVAVVMNDFYGRLHGEDRTAVYPVAEIERARVAAGREVPPGRSGRA